MITLQSMVSSPHATEELKAEGQELLGQLQDIAPLLDLLMTCQYKVCSVGMLKVMNCFRRVYCSGCI